MNKAYKIQKRHFSSGLQYKLWKEIKSDCQSITLGRKCGQKEVIGEEEKKAAKKSYQSRTSFVLKNCNQKKKKIAGIEKRKFSIKNN